MAALKLLFRRTVIALRDPSEAPAAIEAAVRFARDLESDLVGIFVEDAEVVAWSGSATARQVRSRHTTAAPTLLADEFAQAAVIARRRVSAIERRLGVHVAFSVQRAAAASIDLPGLNAGDLLVVLEPGDPMARSSYPFVSLVEAVARAEAPVLFVPSGVAAHRGPVVGIMRDLDTQGARLTSDVAQALGTQSIALLPRHEPHPQDVHPGHPSRVDRTIEIDAPTPTTLERALGHAGERLIVLERGCLAGQAPELFVTLAAVRAAPVLLVGPAQE